MRKQSASSLSLQLTRALSLVGVVSAILIAAFGIWSASKIDNEATVRERTLVRRSLDERLEDMQREQESLTTWDDAVTHAHAGDWPWISENVGIYLNTMFKHDEAFVLDPEDKPVYAMADGKDADPALFQSEAHDAMLLVKALRQKMAAAEKLGGLGMAEYIEVGRQPCLVSVKPILPFTNAVSQAKGMEFLHVSVVRIDDKLLAELGSRQLIANLHYGQTIVPSSSVGTLELPSHGPALGYAIWNRDRPGTNLLKATAPVLAAGFLAFLAFIGVLSSRLQRMADDLIESRAQSQRLALHDTLTGLPNRAHFNEHLRKALEDCQHEKATMALHYVDLDRFKNVNDTLGHPAGDELIRQVATRLTGIAPSGSLVARLGGDEFAIIQAKLSNGKDAQALGAEIGKALREPFDLAGDQALIGASIGIAMCDPTRSDPDELMREADIALYEAKGNGKDRYCLYAPELGAIVKNKRRIERDLRETLKAGGSGLRLVYQPLVGADGTSLQGVEALVRWRHPVDGELAPATFVAVAEERGLIVELGDWVLREACRTLRDTHLPWVAVNVSAMQLREPSFPLKVMTLLGEHGLTPERLQIEITEGVLINPSEQTAQSIMQIREAGIRVALDDFGTGYCSLQYLHRYTVDKIKIDKSFVQDVSSSSTSRALVRSMISLARAFDMEVTAEGIETEAQWAELTQLGCGQLQGFLFAKPMPVSALPLCNSLEGEQGRHKVPVPRRLATAASQWSCP